MLDLVVLIRSYRDEGRLVKDMSAVGSVLGSEGIVFIGFDYVKSRLVLVHRVQDDLEKSERRQETTCSTCYSNQTGDSL